MKDTAPRTREEERQQIAAMCAQVGLSPVEMSALVGEATSHMIYPDQPVGAGTQVGRQEAGMLYRTLARQIAESNPDYRFSAAEMLLATEDPDPAKAAADRDSRFEAARMAGRILFNVWRMDKAGVYGSVGKSVYLIAQVDQVGERKLRETWAAYKTVAHLGAAHYLLHATGRLLHSGMLDGEPAEALKTMIAQTTESCALFLHFAVKFYDYATTRIDKATKLPLLDPSQAWLFDRKKVDMLPKMGCDAALSGQETLALATYKP